MKINTILISGGTGLVGSYLTKFLVQLGYDIIILTRNPKSAKYAGPAKDKVRFAQWDIKKQNIESWAVSEADALIHLAGAGVVAKPWTESYKREILESRILSSKLLVAAIGKYGKNLHTVISASAIGWYGEDRPGLRTPFLEDSPVAKGFLGDTCKAWEESIAGVAKEGKRLVICRIGIVLAKGGGALEEFKKPLGVRVAGILGHGKQIVSWVHIHDLCRIFQFALKNPEIKGTYNAVAPAPVSNKELTLSLAKSLYGNAFISLPVPSFILKIILGDRSIEVLKSTTVSSSKIEQAGFQFHFSDIEQALSNLAS